MKEQRIKTSNPSESIFDSIKHTDESGIDFWYARELMQILEYNEWRNFNNVIKKAKNSLASSHPHLDDHFVEVNKMITIAAGTGKETEREIKDYKLSRRACYLIAQNGDSRKKAIALAQNYFTSQTRKQELREQRGKDIERILARRKLTETEKKFGGVLTEHGVDGSGIAEIKSAGDAALFGRPTLEVKNKLGIKKYKPLADHLPTIGIKAKDLATEMTTYKTQSEDLSGIDDIKQEHVGNNSAVRKMLTESGIYPEKLAAEEDVKKLERKYSEDEIHEIEDEKILSLHILEIDITEIVDRSILEKIAKAIKRNSGSSILRIYYGNRGNKKIIEREVEINSDLITRLRKYLVITDGAL